MPIYKGGSGDEAIKFENIGEGNIKLTNKSSGILIDSIITTDVVTGELINLFNGILGFNMGNLHPNFETVKNNTLKGLDDRSFKTGVLRDGLNTTEGLSSLDTIVQKKAPTPASGDPLEQNLYKFAPQDLSALGYILIDQQNEIYADRAVGLGLALNFGYYIIAIDGLKNDMITENDIKTNIFYIISRYYSSNNYTIGSPEDSIIYTHRGKTQIINNLNVRILDGYYKTISNLGNDNTIFIQHRKSRVPLDIIEQKQSIKKIK